MKKFFLSVVLLLPLSFTYGQLVITTSTPANAVNSFIGTGVTVSNVTYQGVPNSLATFTGPSNMGISSGIIFGSGTSTGVNSNASFFHSDAASGPGDATLDGIASGTTEDAAVLEFDFTAQSDSITFEYVFASEEYSDYANTGFNDVFGFFVSGPGIVGSQNIAIVPGTTSPVTINNVNNGNSPVGVVPSGPCQNCAYYNDNTNGAGATVCYDGMTVVLTARLGISICETYHIKLAVANVNDGAFDSGVFLKANSFSSGFVNIIPNPPSPYTNISLLCPGDSVMLTASNATSWQWDTGDTTRSIWVNNSSAGFHSVIVYGIAGCFLFSQPYQVINVTPVATITPNGLVTLCPGDSAVLTANAGSAYQWSNGATTQSITVLNSGNFTVAVTDTAGCEATSLPVVVNAGVATATITPVGPTAICLGGTVTLSANNGSSYLWSNGATTQNITTAVAGNYTVTVTQAAGCSAISAPQNIVVSVPAATITPAGPTTFCQGGSVSLAANAGSSWLWSTGATTQTISPATSGTFTVTVTDASGCDTASIPVSITVNSASASISVVGNTTLCPGQQASLSANAGLSYLWSNGATTQTINPSSAGNYTVTVTNLNNCTATSTPVAISVSNPTASITTVGSATLCPGNTVTLNANAGNSYLWSTGATTSSLTVSTAGNYTVTVTNADNCTAISNPVAVSVTPPSASITPSGPTTFCQGSNVTLTANAGASYLWSTGATTQSITPSVAGSFLVTVTNANGCDTASAPVNVIVNTGVANITAGGNTTICPGSQVSLTANAGSAYLWSNGATTQSINASSAGSYTVTVTNLNTCTAISLPVAVIVSNPAASITPNGATALCPGNTVTLNANAGNSYLWSTGATTASLTVSAAGNYTVTVTNADNCTAISNPVSVSVTPPSASITPSGPTTFCQGSNVTLTANAGSAYLWSTGATTQSITPSAAGSFIVTVTNANGCDTASAPVNIIVNTATATITPGGNTTICPGNQVSLNANAGSSYLWSTGATSQNISVSTTGTYTVTVTNFNSCTAIAVPVAVTVSNPTALITPSGSTTLCPGGNVTLNANAGNAYQWSNGATTSSVNVTAAGNFTVTVTNADNCTAISAVVAISMSAPMATITPASSTTFCLGDSVILSANAGNAYLWSNGATTQNQSILSPGNYVVTVTNTDGCTAISAVQGVIVNTATAVITAAGNTVFCPNSQVTLQANAGSGYLWSNGETTQDITVNQSGSYFVTVTNFNTCKAVSNSINTLVSLPIAVINASGPTTICPNTTINLTANSGSSYLWSDGSTTQSITVGQNGTYTATVADSIGCQAVSNSISVLVSIPQANITPAGPTTFCDGENVVLQANSGTVFLWSDGSTTQNLVVTQAGNYSVQVTDTAGCKENSSPVSITVLFATATATAQGPTVFCKGDNVSITANSGLAYLWNNGSSAQTIQALVSGNYLVTVTNNNGCTAISSSIFVDVHEFPVVQFLSDTSLICETLKVKFTNKSTFDPGSEFKWNFGDGATSALENPDHIYSVAGTYQVSLIITTPTGCISGDTVDVTVIYYPPPIAMFKAEPDFTTIVNSMISFNDQSANAVRWHWDFGDGKISGEQNPVHFYEEEGKYKVTLRIHSLADCEDIHTEEIYVSPFFIPNSFSPNNDGRNDVFFNANHELNVDGYKMLIWNRWGELIYSSNSYSNPWNGADQNGSLAPEGVYIYVISVNTKSGKRLEYKGSVNLIR